MGGAYIFFCGLLVVQCFLLGEVAAQADEDNALEEMIGQPEGENSLPTDVIAAGRLEGAQPEGESSLSQDMTMTIPQSEQQAQAVEADEPSAGGGDPSVQAAAAAADDDDDNGQSLSKREALASLEEAQLYLQRARVIETTENCKAGLYSADGELTWSVTFLLELKYNETLEKLGNARKSLSQCADALSSAKNSDETTKPLLYLVRQAVSHIDEARTSINEINMTAISSTSSSLTTPATPDVEFQGEGLRSCKFDGTTCQFSSCGEGRKLPKCVIGFASGVTGGSRGVSYTVTSPEDNPSRPQPGTFRYGVQLASQRNGGVWITFARSMTISLRDMVWIRSSTTVDGRGVEVIFTNRCFVLGGVSNVILHNFQISGVPQTDTVHIFGGSRGIWVDHLTSFDAKLGLVSVVQGSTDVTISNCYLSNRNFNMLLGASDADSLDRNMRVTVFKNWFKDSMQRMPHCRWGYCHVINNLYTNWGYYAIGGRAHAQILSESNAFMPGRRREVTPWFPGAGGVLDQTSIIQSKNDLYLGGSTFHQFGGFGKASSAPKYTTMHQFPPVVAPNRLVQMVQSCSGALVGRKLQRCLYSS